MKFKKSFIICLTSVLFLMSCATNKNIPTSKEKLSIYDYALTGAEKSYKDYENKKGYSITGPVAPGSIGRKPKEGEKAQYFVQFDSGKSMIQYLDDNGIISIEKIHIAKHNDGLYLSKYIGKSKTKFLNDFPLELDKYDAEYDFGGLRYDSEKDGRFFVQVTVENEVITHINITVRNEKEIQRYKDLNEWISQGNTYLDYIEKE